MIAVADGIVLESRDGVTDNPPLFEPPPPTNVELAAIGGNYVLLDIGGGRYVHFLHLERSSVRAPRGQRVRQGDVLGRVGNSGNTNGAHLHFNVVNGRRLETAEGLPYVFDHYVTRGSTTASAAFGESPVEPATARDARQSMPINGAILQSARP